ncbi:MAG: hypothetical protein ABID45_03430 [Patescibacteria group bacterium]
MKQIKGVLMLFGFMALGLYLAAWVIGMVGPVINDWTKLTMLIVPAVVLLIIARSGEQARANKLLPFGIGLMVLIVILIGAIVLKGVESPKWQRDYSSYKIRPIGGDW